MKEKNTSKPGWETALRHHISHTRRKMTNIEECKIIVTVRNGNNMKCKLKGTVNIKIQGGKTVKLTEVQYVPQAVKNIVNV